MEIKTNLKKIGDSYFFIVPKSYIDVYELLTFVEQEEYKTSISKNGDAIIYKRVKKIDKDEKQKNLSDFKKLKGGNKNDK